MKSHLENGGLVVYPTSTLPSSLVACQYNPDWITCMKQKSTDFNASKLGVANMEQVIDLVEIPSFLEDFLSSFDKGGITTILPAKEILDDRLGGANVAIRVFAHPAAISLAEKFGPITATSANESGVELRM